MVSTPIGNLRDITLRALDILGAADLVLAEDTRVARKLLDAYGLKPRLLSYHDHNAAAAGAAALHALGEGRTVALISDAGTPLLSDPGFPLVRDALAAGARVFPIPGASALLAALVACGLPAERFLFAGFLPPKAAARRAALEELAQVPATLVFYETGPRLAASLADMAAVLGPREAAVARELTKLFEEVRRGPLADLAAAAEDAEKRGEHVVVVGPPQPVAQDPAALDAALKEAMQRLSVRDAAAEVAARFGAARKDAYARALALKGGA